VLRTELEPEAQIPELFALAGFWTRIRFKNVVTKVKKSMNQKLDYNFLGSNAACNRQKGRFLVKIFYL
jgi:hypothetical protein